MDEEYEDGEQEATPRSEENTALLPMSFFPNPPEVGKTCKVEVVHVYEDEVEVKYISHKSDSDSDSDMDRKIDEAAQQ